MAFDSYFVLAGLAALLVGLSKGGLPTVGMLAVPLLSLFMSPVKAAVLLLPIYVISDVVSVWLYRKNFSAANLKILIPAGVLGVFIGWLTASFTSDSAVKLMIGCLGVGFCLNTWLRKTSQDKQAVDIKKVGFGARSRALLASFRTQVDHRFKFMCCHSACPSLSLRAPPPYSSQSSTPPKFGPTNCCSPTRTTT